MQTRAEYVVANQVPAGRRQEILRYLELFGYKPESTVVQVHVAGFFNKKGSSAETAQKGPPRRKGTAGRRLR